MLIYVQACNAHGREQTAEGKNAPVLSRKKRRISEIKLDREVVRAMRQKNLTREEAVTRQNMEKSD